MAADMLFLGIADAGDKIQQLVEAGLYPIMEKSITIDTILQVSIDIIIQLSATVLLFLIVRFFLWKPITNILEQRREAIDRSLTEAEESKANAIAIESQLKGELAEAKSKIKDMLDKAEKDANLKRESIINAAKEDAKHRLENLELELEQEKKSMEKEIREEIVNVAFAAAEKIVKKEINQDKYLDVVNDILKGANE